MNYNDIKQLNVFFLEARVRTCFVSQFSLLSSLCLLPLTHITSAFSETITVYFCTQAGVLGFQLLHELQHATRQDRPPVVQWRADAGQRLGAGTTIWPQMGVSSNAVSENKNDCVVFTACKRGLIPAARQHVLETVLSF